VPFRGNFTGLGTGFRGFAGSRAGGSVLEPWLLADPPLEVWDFESDVVTTATIDADTYVVSTAGRLTGATFAQAVEVRRPLLIADVALGKAAAVFTGDQILTCTNAAVNAAMAGNDTAFAWIVVCQLTVDGNQRRIIASQAGDNATSRWSFGHSSSLKMESRKAAVVAAGVNNITSDVPLVLTWDTDNDTIMRMNGVEEYNAGQDAGAVTTTVTHIGGQIDPADTLTRALNGAVCQLALYNRRLTATDLTNWATYLGVDV